MTEDALHKAILKYLRTVLPHGWLVMHVPNGGSRNPIEGAKMKALGVMAGWPDISIYGPGMCCFMEVKTQRGRLSNSQHAVIDRLADMGHPVAVVRSIDDARTMVKEWGLPTRDTWEHISQPAARVIGNMTKAMREAAE
jgi:hypothetical protein